jgi:hypothetical protein
VTDGKASLLAITFPFQLTVTVGCFRDAWMTRATVRP